MKHFKLSALFVVFLCSSLISAARADSKAVAKIGSTVLTENDMRKEMGMQLYQAENSLYTTQKNWIDQKAQSILFDQAAKDAGLSRKDWEAREIDAKAAAPDPNQVQQMAGQFIRPGVASTDTLKMATDYVANQNKQMRRSQLYMELSKKTPVEVLVYKPEAPRINVTYSPNDPMKGDSKAPVTIVEFTDFQCPFCKRANETLHQVEEAYPKQVKIVVRQYPLPFHDRAKPAAEAALCANDQGKYWPYHEKLFADQKLSDTDLHQYAKDLNLNEKKFNQCMASNQYAVRVQNDIADGQRFGVNGTPAFFVNGEFINGAQPLNNFKTAIDNALSQKK